MGGEAVAASLQVFQETVGVISHSSGVVVTISQVEKQDAASVRGLPD